MLCFHQLCLCQALNSPFHSAEFYRKQPRTKNSCRQRHSTPEESLVFELFNDPHVSFLAKQNSGRDLLLLFFYFTNFERNEVKYIFSRYKPQLRALFLFSDFHGVFNNNNRLLKCSAVLLLQSQWSKDINNKRHEQRIFSEELLKVQKLLEKILGPS